MVLNTSICFSPVQPQKLWGSNTDEILFCLDFTCATWHSIPLTFKNQHPTQGDIKLFPNVNVLFCYCEKILIGNWNYFSSIISIIQALSIKLQIIGCLSREEFSVLSSNIWVWTTLLLFVLDLVRTSTKLWNECSFCKCFHHLESFNILPSYIDSRSLKIREDKFEISLRAKVGILENSPPSRCGKHFCVIPFLWSSSRFQVKFISKLYPLLYLLTEPLTYSRAFKCGWTTKSCHLSRFNFLIKMGQLWIVSQWCY